MDGLRADIKKDVRLLEPTSCAKALRKTFVSEAIEDINRATCWYQQEASKIISKGRHHTRSRRWKLDLSVTTVGDLIIQASVIRGQGMLRMWQGGPPGTQTRASTKSAAITTKPTSKESTEPAIPAKGKSAKPTSMKEPQLREK